MFEIAAVAGTFFLELSNAELGHLFIDNAFLNRAGFQENFCLVVATFEVAVVGSADFFIGMFLDLEPLFPGLGAGYGGRPLNLGSSPVKHFIDRDATEFQVLLELIAGHELRCSDGIEAASTTVFGERFYIDADS